jgi:hypothetical protein
MRYPLSHGCECLVRPVQPPSNTCGCSPCPHRHVGSSRAAASFVILTGVRIVSVARIKANQGGSVTFSTGWLLLSSGLLVLLGIHLVVPQLS